MPNLINVKQEWCRYRPIILHNIEQYNDELNIYEVLNKLYIGEYALIQSEHIHIIGYSYLNAFKEKVFFVYYAWGDKLQNQLENIRTYLKDVHGCNKVEFYSNSKAHDRLYRKLAKQEQYKTSTVFNVVL